MTKPRPTKLKYVGGYRPDGRPHMHLGDYGIPAEDLEGEVLAALDADQIKLAEDSGLYEAVRPEPKQAKPKGESAPRKRKAPARMPNPEQPPTDSEPSTEHAADGAESEPSETAGTDESQGS